ncbi:MAG: restriction endonuclease subunit S [Chromatiales bacterium]|nr:restriction endonuclease subunit S [Chromatiales bacterium]
MSWEEFSLDQLGFVSRGKSRHRPRDAEHLYGGPYPFVQTGDVKHAGLYLTEYNQTYSEAGLAQSKLWPVGTLCITIAANIADTSILGIDACFPDSVIGFIPDKEKADARFVKYMFDAKLKLQYRQFTQGAAQDNLSQKKLLSLKFSVPKIDVQREIADVVASYDELIGNNIHRIQLLEESARLLYREWFVHLRFPGHEHVKVVDGVPEGWSIKPLTDIADMVMGQSPKSEYYNDTGDGYPFHQGVTNYGERFVEHVTYCSKPTRLAESGDILCSVRAPVGRLNITLDKITIGRGLSALRSKTGNQSFLYYQLKTYFFKENIIGSGAIYAAVTKKDMENIPLLTPTTKLIEEFEENSKSIDAQIQNLTNQNRQLSAARDLLLPRLMNGDIAV